VSVNPLRISGGATSFDGPPYLTVEVPSGVLDAAFQGLFI
jgi:hypothetical protein